MIEYELTLNGGVEAFGTEASITANEKTRSCTPELLAKEIAHVAGLVDEKTAKYVIDNLGEAIVNLMAQGYRVPLMNGNDQLCSFYADVALKQTFNLEEAKKRDASVTVLNADCFSLITASDIKVRAYAEQEQKFTDLLVRESEGVQRVGTSVKAKVMKKTSSSSGSNAGGGNVIDPSNPEGGMEV